MIFCQIAFFRRKAALTRFQYKNKSRFTFPNLFFIKIKEDLQTVTLQHIGGGLGVLDSTGSPFDVFTSPPPPLPPPPPMEFFPVFLE